MRHRPHDLPCRLVLPLPPPSVRSVYFSRRRLRDQWPATTFVPFPEDPNWSDQFGNMGKLAGLLKGSVVRSDNGDRPDFAFPLPLAHQAGKGNDTVLPECGDKPLQVQAWHRGGHPRHQALVDYDARNNR
jgi:hypothetical protein